jgi:hypothetical protein
LYDEILEEFAKRLREQGVSELRTAALIEVLKAPGKPKPADVVQVLSGADEVNKPGSST